ncbi:MAG: thioredoxin [Ardenticatenaceae bacterium]
MVATDKAITINDQTFEKWVLQSELPVALLFCTPKFGKCQQIEPLWQQLATEYGGRLRVVQVIVDDNRQWARHYGVKLLPTTLWLRGGKEVQRAEGLPDLAELRERADALLANRAPRLPEKVNAARFSSAKGPVKLTDSTFAEVLKDERPVLVDFWAEWCRPCHMIAPAVDKLAREMGERALVSKLNIDQNQRTAQQFRVMSIPTLLIFKGGRVVDTIVGAQPGAVIRRKLMAHI